MLAVDRVFGKLSLSLQTLVEFKLTSGGGFFFFARRGKGEGLFPLFGFF